MEKVYALRKNLMKLLDQKGYGMSELSRRSGVARKTLYGWTSGNRPKSIEDLYKVANALEVTMEDLSFGESDPADDLKPLRLEVGTQLRTWRDRVRMTLLEASRALKIPMENLELIETGSEDLPISLLSRIATTYQLQPEVISAKLLQLLKR